MQPVLFRAIVIVTFHKPSAALFAAVHKGHFHQNQYIYFSICPLQPDCHVQCSDSEPIASLPLRPPGLRQQQKSTV